MQQSHDEFDEVPRCLVLRLRVLSLDLEDLGCLGSRDLRQMRILSGT